MKNLSFKRQNNRKSALISLFNLILLFSIIKSEIVECEKDKPILISEECQLDYCTKEQFSSGYCLINNTKIKTQWINNLIVFGDLSYRYIGFGSYSNGDFVIESACYPQQPKRIFYGLKHNGRPLFNTTNNKQTPYYSINVTGQDNLTLEFEGAIIKLSSTENNGKEYYFSLSKLYGNAELFDFENDEVYHKKIGEFVDFGVSIVRSLRHCFFPLTNSDSQYYYIFGFVSFGFGISTINFQKHIFNTLTDFEKTKSYTEEGIKENDGAGFEVSCFKTDNEFNNCLALNLLSNKFYYTFIIYDNNFSNKTSFKILSYINDESTFYKCIYLEGEAGVYAYYLNNTGIPNIVFKFMMFDISNNEFKFYLSSIYPE